MSAKTDQIIANLQNAVATQAAKNESKAYDTAAVVRRIEGDTAWVHIPGGVDETPVKLTIAASVGDTVQVRVSGGRAFLVGNGSAPPTDDTTAIAARSVANKAQATAQAAEQTAREAMSRISGDSNQYAWHTETGTDTGTHITEVPKEDFIADPENGGGNTVFRSNGMAIRDGLTELATFGAGGVQIGQTGQTHTEIDYHSMQLIDKEGNTYFHVSDLRDEDGRLSETFIGDGMHMSVDTFASIDTSKPVTVTIDGIATTAYTLHVSGITFDSMPPDGAVIVVTYTPVYTDTKAYTLGKRSADSIIGIFSYAEGYDVQATGEFTHAEGGDTEAHGAYSHAEGFDTKSYGNYSHAEGMSSRSSGEASHAEGSNTVASGQWSHTQNVGTKANGIAQTAIGKYNDNQSNNALEIGNGASNSARSNAFEVDWSGNSDQQGRATTEDMTAAEVSDFIEGLDFSAATLADFIVEQGEGYGANNVKGYYRKWNSGKCEFWYDWSAASGMTTAVWAAPIYFVDTSAFNTVWNGLFTAKPTNLQISSTNSQLINVYAWDYDAQGINKLRLLTCNGKTGAAYSFSLYAVGTWK